MTQHGQSLLDRVMKWAQFLSVMGALIAGSTHYLSTFAKYRDMANANAYKIERMERYLAFKNPEYWQVVGGLIQPGEPDVYQVKSRKALSQQELEKLKQDVAPSAPQTKK